MLSNSKTNLKTLNSKPNFWYWINVYKASSAIFAAQKLTLFRQLEQQPQHVTNLAKNLGLIESKLIILLQLFHKIGILEQTSPNYFSVSPQCARLLPLLELESFFAEKYIQPTNLINGLKGIQRPPLSELMQIAGFKKMYYEAMEVSTSTIAPFIVRLCRHQKEKKILDIGGGDGNLMVHLATYFGSEGQYTVYDKFAPNKQLKGVEGELINFIEGDVLDEGELIQQIHQHTIFIISNLLHLLSPAARLSLLKLLLNNSKTGSSMIIYDQFLEESNSVNIMDFMQIDWLLGKGDFSYTEKTFRNLLESIGFDDIIVKTSTFFPGKIFLVQK